MLANVQRFVDILAAVMVVEQKLNLGKGLSDYRGKRSSGTKCEERDYKSQRSFLPEFILLNSSFLSWVSILVSIFYIEIWKRNGCKRKWLTGYGWSRSELVLGVLSSPDVDAAPHSFVVVTLTNSEI